MPFPYSLPNSINNIIGKWAGGDNIGNSSTPTRLSYPKELSNKDIHPATIHFSFFERKSASSSKKSDEIQLYMPESVSQPSTVSWDVEKFGAIGEVAKQYGRMGSIEDVNNVVNSIGDVLGAMGPRIRANLGSKAASMLGGNVSAEGLMGEVMGKVPNPYLTMVFKGVDFRSFSYVFKFTPYSESDCQTIFDIIKTFRKNALPTKEDAFLAYPKECEIQYFWRGEENKWLHKFKRAVCTGIDVDYTAAGMFSTMRNGFPSTIIVSTKWSEIEIVTREDVENEGF